MQTLGRVLQIPIFPRPIAAKAAKVMRHHRKEKPSLCLARANSAHDVQYVASIVYMITCECVLMLRDQQKAFLPSFACFSLRRDEEEEKKYENR